MLKAYLCFFLFVVAGDRPTWIFIKTFKLLNILHSASLLMSFSNLFFSLPVLEQECKVRFLLCYEDCLSKNFKPWAPVKTVWGVGGGFCGGVLGLFFVCFVFLRLIDYICNFFGVDFWLGFGAFFKSKIVFLFCFRLLPTDSSSFSTIWSANSTTPSRWPQCIMYYFFLIRPCSFHCNNFILVRISCFWSLIFNISASAIC